MITDTEEPVVWDGREYPGIIELGFTAEGAFVVALWSTPPPEPRGRYFTSLAISPDEYRRHNKTEAGFRRLRRTSLVIADDWGKAKTIRASPSVLDALEVECAHHGLPDLAPAARPSRKEGGGT